MKKFLAIGIFVFLTFCANMTAEHSQDELKEYVQQRILNLQDQLDDISFEEQEKYSYMHGYLYGEKNAYMDIWKNIID